MSGEALGLILFVGAILIAGLIEKYRNAIRDWFNREPISLDLSDGVQLWEPLCTVHACDDPALTRVHVGHEWWSFCLEHGLPYLRDEKRGPA